MTEILFVLLRPLQKVLNEQKRIEISFCLLMAFILQTSSTFLHRGGKIILLRTAIGLLLDHKCLGMMLQVLDCKTCFHKT